MLQTDRTLVLRDRRKARAAALSPSSLSEKQGWRDVEGMMGWSVRRAERSMSKTFLLYDLYDPEQQLLLPSSTIPNSSCCCLRPSNNGCPGPRVLLHLRRGGPLGPLVHHGPLRRSALSRTKAKLVGLDGLEPSTSVSSGERSPAWNKLVHFELLPRWRWMHSSPFQVQSHYRLLSRSAT